MPRRPSRAAGVRRRGRQLLLVPVLAVAATVVVLPADADMGGVPHVAPPHAAPGTFSATPGPPAWGKPVGVGSGRKSH